MPSRSSAAKTSPATSEVSSGSPQLHAKASTTSDPAQPVVCIQRPKTVSVGSDDCELTTATKTAGCEQAGQQHEPDAPLGEQLGQLEASSRAAAAPAGPARRAAPGWWSSAHRPTSASPPVRARKAASSGGTTGASSRTATPAPTSRATRSSSEPHRAADDERVGVAARPLPEPRTRMLGRAGGDASRARAGSEVTQPVVELAALRGELLDRAGEDDASGDEDRHLGAQRGEVVHPVAGEHDRDAVVRQLGR